MANWLRPTCFGWVLGIFWGTSGWAGWQLDGAVTGQPATAIVADLAVAGEWGDVELGTNFSLPFMSEGAMMPSFQPDWLGLSVSWAAGEAKVLGEAISGLFANFQLAATYLGGRVAELVEVMGAPAPPESPVLVLGVAPGKSGGEAGAPFVLLAAHWETDLPAILPVGGEAELLLGQGEPSVSRSWLPRLLAWASLPLVVGLPVFVLLLLSRRRRDRKQRSALVGGGGRAMGRSVVVGSGRLSPPARAR